MTVDQFAKGLGLDSSDYIFDTEKQFVYIVIIIIYLFSILHHILLF